MLKDLKAMPRQKLLYFLISFFALIFFILWLCFFSPSLKDFKKNQIKQGPFSLLSNYFNKIFQENEINLSLIQKGFSQFVKGDQAQKIKIENAIQERMGVVVEAKEIYITDNEMLISFLVQNNNDFAVLMPPEIYLLEEGAGFEFIPEIQTDSLIYLPLKRQLKKKELVSGVVVFPRFVDEKELSKQNFNILFKEIQKEPPLTNIPKANLLLGIKNY